MLSLAPALQPAASADLPDAASSPAGTAPLLISTRNAAPAAMRRDDWEALFKAATERLHQRVEDLAWTDAAADRLRARADRLEPLRECVAALQQLQRELDARPAETAAPQHLTGNLRTRAQFQLQLARSLATTANGAPALAVLCLGLDGFKRINEQYGRDIGDATLNIVARRLARALRAQDTVCRLEADRFACLLEAPADREQLSRVACKLFDAVAAPLRVGAVTLSVLPSIGITLCPADGDTGPLLLRRAEAAMGRAKRHQQGYAFSETRSDL